jgi:hypothetical protein
MVTSPTQKQDYGILTVHEYVDPLSMERTKPTNYDKDDDITMSWTARIEHGYPMPTTYRIQNFVVNDV